MAPIPESNNQHIWVFLRGLAREAGHWRHFPREFEERVHGAKVLTVDLPGAGCHWQQECPATISGILQEVRKDLRHNYGVSEQVSLLSISLGGMVALEWMRQHPEELKSAVLINSSVKTLSPFYERLRWQVMTQFLKAAGQKNLVEREKQILKLISRRREVHDEVAKEWAQVAEERPVSKKNILRQLYAAFRFSADRPSASVPALIISGLGDELVDPGCSERMHQEWGWPIRRHPWGGHDLTLDDGPWVAEQVLDWVSRRPQLRRDSVNAAP